MSQRVWGLLLGLAVLTSAASWADPSRPHSYREMVPGVLKAMGQKVPEPAPLALSTMTLDQALAVIHTRHPEAMVTGTFYDWRTTSEYRSVAGLHLGYDISMPAGSAVPVPWAGKVVAVANWVGREYGITVETDGYRTTYGHLSPLVHEGDVVIAGQPIGTIVHDHVDVKMRDASGNYVDFGAHATNTVAEVGLVAPPAANARELGILKFLIAQETLYQAQDLASQEESRNQALNASLDSLAATERQLAQQAPAMQKYFDDGLVAKVEVKATQMKYEAAKRQLADSSRQRREAAQRAAQAKRDVTWASRMLDNVRADNRRLGINEDDAIAFVSHFIDRHPEVARSVDQQRAARLKAQQTLLHGSTLAREKERMEMLERLYDEGAVARRELDDQRARYEKLKASIIAP